MRLSFAIMSAALWATPFAIAKEYNMPQGVNSEAQASINRIMADIRTQGEGAGSFSTFESSCEDLEIGTLDSSARPDQQIIVADQIINVAGQCRVRRSIGGFGAPEDSTAASQASTAQ